MTTEELQRRLDVLEASLHARLAAIERILHHYVHAEDELRGAMLDEILRIKNLEVRELVFEQWQGPK